MQMNRGRYPTPVILVSRTQDLGLKSHLKYTYDNELTIAILYASICSTNESLIPMMKVMSGSRVLVFKDAHKYPRQTVHEHILHCGKTIGYITNMSATVSLTETATCERS